MKRILYLMTVLILVVSGFVFVSFEPKINHSSSSIAKPLSVKEKQTARKNWESTPEGILFKKWEASAEGKKVQTSADKIRKSVKDYTLMEGMVTSLTLPPGSRVGFGIMVKINGDDYILAFGPEISNKKNTNSKNEFEQLHKLKVKDKISIKSHHISKAPKYAYPKIAGDYIEKNDTVIYERVMRKEGC